MDPLLESWQLSLHARRPKTRVQYMIEVSRFARWFAGDLTTVTKTDLLRWIQGMQQRGLKGNTIRSRLVAVSSFYRWAAAEDEVPSNPTAGLVVGKPHEPPPDTLTTDQIVGLLKVCEGTGFYERRDAAVIRTFLATGLRVSELASLQLVDLDLPNRLAAVRDGKGGRSRVVRFDPTTAASLDRYKRVRAKHRHAPKEQLWLGKVGPLGARGVADMLARRALQAGIGHVHPHQLRHTWADRWLAGGGQEGDLQQLGGWKSAAVMRRYGEARATDRALNAYDQIDPMKGL